MECSHIYIIHHTHTERRREKMTRAMYEVKVTNDRGETLRQTVLGDAALFELESVYYQQGIPFKVTNHYGLTAYEKRDIAKDAIKDAEDWLTYFK